MYNLIEYSNNYSKTSGSLWQYYRDEPDDNIANSESFTSKIKITGNTPDADNKTNIEIVIPLKYLSNFWRTLEMSLINCEVELILTWSKNCVITYSTGDGKFKITEAKQYIPWTQDNAKLLEQLQSGFKIAIKWNKYQSELSKQVSDSYLDYLLYPKLQGINRLFVLSFENR